MTALEAVAAQPQIPVMLGGVRDRFATASVAELSPMVVSVTVVVADTV